jgi:RsiW-degrading membrane proteinase PrsW (M82 family)
MAAVSGRRRRWRWLLVLLVGFLLWCASVLVIAVTGNANLVPTVVLLGSFLVPVTAVVWNFDHEASSELTAQRVFAAFVVGGVLGVLGASLLEAWLLQEGPLMYIGVGLIEELVKALALVVVAWGLRRYTTRDGVVLGAAVGFGFASLETSGYAFNALLTEHGLSLGALIDTELLRGILAPLGHGLWTAILGGVMFHAARSRGRIRFTWGLLGTYVLVAVLHAVWDAMRGIAVALTLLLTATRAQMISIEYGKVPRVHPAQELLFVVIQFAGLVVISLIAVGVLFLIWRRWARSAP